MTVTSIVVEDQRIVEDRPRLERDAAEPEKVKPEDPRIDATSGSTGSTGKRAKSKKRREAQQEFTHSWMVGALKGHTAPVLDMNFSSNGKFLASCAEDCGLRPEEEMLDPGDTDSYAACKVKQEAPTTNKQASRCKSRSSTTSTASNDASSSSTTASTSTDLSPSVKEDRAILSRRQRKNRTRTPRDQRREIREDEDEQPTQERHRSRHGHCSTRHSESMSTNANRRDSTSRGQIPNNTRPEENESQIPISMSGHSVESTIVWRSQRNKVYYFSETWLNTMLHRYTLTQEQMMDMGYPVECGIYPGCAYIIILRKHPTGHRIRGYHRLDVNAREFVPGSGRICQIESEGDSGHCTGSSVESSDLEQESSSDSDNIGESSASIDSSSSGSSYQQETRRDRSPNINESNKLPRKCARCYQYFFVNKENGEYVQEESCVYHWGKFRNGPVDNMWECCLGLANDRGCTTAENHVWTGLDEGCNGPFPNYVRTRSVSTGSADINLGVYALDCEMCFTKLGLELARVTVVGLDGEIVYDTLVRPIEEVIDYNTRFSGITAEDLSKAWKTLTDVQNDLTSFIYAETILIGHGLENDLRALRLLHSTVIDTCVAFPHVFGYPYRSSLKTLARTILWRDIQVAEHDSAEDARVVLDLMLRRLELDLL
ncbi:uncharacterized protein LOC108622925 isoform X2 [Ceratina calcarata]|uniref:Uncharacterized protein LOC108622925 isoform X2 n=1 Tax=Ceratina calcarata TaxID=156304 RepID=A0AAJ7IU10_9HYME|nr:uncharacterized protein LOC108622925 isoform X2 [Ceratina calcarata]